MKPVAFFYNRDQSIYLFAIVSSILLSLWVDFRQTVINPDGICYIISAEAMKSGIQEAMSLCGQAHWPFYSVLLSAFAQITHLSYIPAAYVLNSIFTIVSVLTFTAIVKELGGDRKTLWLAVLVILLAHDFNAVREYIIRDHGYWTFYLLSLLFLLKYVREPNWATGSAWSGSILIATLFRVEGIAFLFLLPFTAWFSWHQPISRRALSFLNLNLFTLFIGIVILGWLFLHPESLSKLGRIEELLHQLTHGFSLVVQRYEASKIALANYVLSSDSAPDAGIILFLALMSWYVFSVITSLSLAYTLLLVYACWNKTTAFRFNAHFILISYVIINLAITICFLLQHLFLSKRYLMALSLVLMLYVPFALQHLFTKWAILRYRIFLCVSLFFILFSALGGILDFGYSKNFIREAGDWLTKNVPPNASLYSNSYQVMFYSNHFGNTVYMQNMIMSDISKITDYKWKQYDYLAINVGHTVESRLGNILKEISVLPIRVFHNERGDRVLIYKNVGNVR